MECAHRGAVAVVPARRERGSGAGDSPGVLSGVLSTTKAFGLSFLRDDAAEKEPSRARRRPSGAIKSLSWAPSPDGGRARLLALTETSIEEWDVDDGGRRPSRARTPSSAPARARSGSRRRARARLRRARPGRGGPGAVVAAREGADRWSLLLCARPPGEASAVVASSSGALPPGAVPAATRRGARGRDDACVHAGGIPADAALVTTSGGGAALFAGEGMRDQLLLHDPAAGGGRVLARARSAGDGRLAAVDRAHGRRRVRPRAERRRARVGWRASRSPRAFPAAPKPGREPAEAAEEPAPAPSDPAAAAEAVRAEFSPHERGDAARGPPAETSFRLRAAGALAGDASGAPFAACSRAIVDALPKHWPGKGGPGPATETQLEDKTRRHDAFTRWLADATGVWSVLPAGEREQILEHGELVAALLCVRYLHNEAALAEEEAEAEGTLAEDEPAGVAAALLREIAATAGAALQGSDAAVRGRPAAEVCYSRATGAAAALLPALADATARRAGGGVDASFAERAAALDALSRAALGALGAAAGSAGTTPMLYPAVHAGAVAPPPRWFAGPSARAALFAAATAAAALRAEAARGATPTRRRPSGTASSRSPSLSSTRAPRSWCRSSRGRGRARSRARSTFERARRRSPRFSTRRATRRRRRRRAKAARRSATSARPGSPPTRSPPSLRRTSGTSSSRSCARRRRSRRLSGATSARRRRRRGECTTTCARFGGPPRTARAPSRGSRSSG